MDSATFAIDIRTGEPEGDVTRFRPGETIQGSVRITPKGDLQARHVFARLTWHTEGRGDRDQGIVGQQDCYQGLLKEGTPSHFSFHFRLPDGPWSYAGHYVSVIWAVEIVIDLALARDIRSEKVIILAPDR